MRSLKLIVVLCLLPVFAASRDEQVSQVSLLQLIATPSRFDGRVIGTFGFLALGRETPLLYLHKEDSENVLIPNAIWLEPTGEMRRDAAEITLKYVSIVGTFRAFESGAKGHNKIEGVGGGLTNIKSCTVWSDPDHPLAHRYEGTDRLKLKKR